MSDLISRKAAIDAAVKMFEAWYGGSVLRDREIRARFDALPSVQPEYRLDEWCTNCKEYDQEKRCCPRFNRVIQTTLQEMQSERKKGKWERHNTYHGDDTSGYIDPDWRCSECGKQANINEWFLYDLTDFCPNCGADMRGGDNGTDEE